MGKRPAKNELETNLHQREPGQGEIIVIDDIRPNYYADYIKNWARVYQMVDNDRAPLIINGRENSTVVFPPKAYGTEGQIIKGKTIKRKQTFVFTDEDQKRYACVVIEIPNEQAANLRKTVETRIQENTGQAGLTTYAGRITNLSGPGVTRRRR